MPHSSNAAATERAPSARLVDDFSAPYLKFNGREPRTLEELAIARQLLSHSVRLREIKAMAAKLALLDAHLPALAEHGIKLQYFTAYPWDSGKVLSFHPPHGDRDNDQLRQALLAIGFREIERKDYFGRTDHVLLKHGRALVVRLEVSKLPTQAPAPAREWRVFVHTRNVGFMGSVTETTEELARCAALSKFGAEGSRPAPEGNTQREEARAIYLDDDFDVRPS